MDFTGAQFGGHSAFPEVPIIPGVDPWMHFPYDYDNVVPSTLFITDHQLANPTPSNPRLVGPFELQNPEFFPGFPLAAGEQVAHSGLEDTASTDLGVYPLTVNLMFTNADFNNLLQPFEHPTYFPHHLTTPGQGQQQFLPALDSHPPFFTGCWSPGGVPPVSQHDANQDDAFPALVGSLEDAIPPSIDYTSPAQVWSYMDARDDDKYVCTWREGSGEVCSFQSTLDLVKRHIRQVHFRIR
jgi:hypothetical protein